MDWHWGGKGEVSWGGIRRGGQVGDEAVGGGVSDNGVR